MPLIFIENVYCCFDLDSGRTDLVGVCWLVLQQMYLLSKPKDDSFYHLQKFQM